MADSGDVPVNVPPIYVGPPFPAGPDFPKPQPLPPVIQPPPVEPPIRLDPLGAGGHLYWSTQGDWWDLIALKVYGMKRGDDHLMHRLLEANYHLRDTAKFAGGIRVVIPAITTKTVIPLVPWKSTTVV